MPLNSAALQSGILTVCSAPANSSAGCAQQWANAVIDYARAIAPAVVPGTVEAAGAAMVATMTGGFSVPGGGAAALESAFAAFALAVGAGMVGFVPVPPPRPVGFAGLAAPPAPVSHGDAAARTAILIDAWMRSGSATPASGGPPIFWT